MRKLSNEPIDHEGQVASLGKVIAGASTLTPLHFLPPLISLNLSSEPSKST